jgi:hypothetical protein
MNSGINFCKDGEILKVEVCLSKRNPHFKRSLLCADFYV